MLKKIGNLLILFIIFGAVGFAENITLNVSVSSKTVPINQTLQYTIKLEGNSSGLPGMNLPALPDFVVLGQSSSTQIQIINGQQSSAKSYIFTLQPKKQGKSFIPALNFNYNNNIYKTELMEINVVGYVTPNASPTQGYNPFSFFDDDPSPFTVVQQSAQQQVFVERVPYKKVLYPGEKTLVDFKLYYERGFYQGPVYNPPKMAGFVAKTMPGTDKPVVVDYKNKKFNLLKNTQVIYPLSPGKYTIGAAQIQYVDSPFGGVKTLATEPYTVTVLKLPQPQPEDFSGAIGSFKLQVDYRPGKSINAGDLIPLNITIVGKGNLDMVNELAIPVSLNVNKFLEGIDNSQTNGLNAKKVFKYFITPTVAGSFAIPQFKFCYFDPQQKSYKYLTQDFPEVKVKGALAGKVAVTATGATTGQGINISFDKDLIKTIIVKVFKVSVSIVLLALIGASLYFIYTRLLSPVRKLKIRFIQIRNVGDSDFVRESHDILRELVRIKYKVNLAGLPIREIKTKLKDETKGNLITALEKQYEELKFTGVQAISNETRQLIMTQINKLF